MAEQVFHKTNTNSNDAEYDEDSDCKPSTPTPQQLLTCKAKNSLLLQQRKNLNVAMDALSKHESKDSLSTDPDYHQIPSVDIYGNTESKHKENESPYKRIICEWTATKTEKKESTFQMEGNSWKETVEILQK